MLGPINIASAFSTTAVQPVVELTREGVQAVQPVQPVQPTQPVQPAPVVQNVAPVSNQQQGSANQRQPASNQPADAKQPGQPQAANPNGQTGQPRESKSTENNGQSKSGLTPQELALLQDWFNPTVRCVPTNRLTCLWVETWCAAAPVMITRPGLINSDMP
jgi:hypothetical protein